MGRELQTLCFSAGKRCRGLTETQIAEADLVKDAECGNDLWHIDEKRRRFADRQLQNFVNILAVIADFQNAALEARAAALFADELYVREKLHLHGDGAVSLAGFAAAARNVKGKMTGGVAAAFGIRRIRKNVADGVESLEIGGRIRTRRAADGRLVDDDDFPNVRIAFDAIAEFLAAAAGAPGGERFVEHIVDQS